jgi:hypothetical protein
MKLFVENWRKHLHEQEINNLRREMLTEISQNDYEYIKDWMRNAPDEAYSFNNLFGDKKRVAIPVESGTPEGPIGEIVNFFQNNGWKIDFKDSTVSREMTTVIPRGPKAGEKVTKVRKERIGKALRRAGDLFDKYSKLTSSPHHLAHLAVGDPDPNEEKIKALELKMKAEFPHTESKEIPFSTAEDINKKLIPFWDKKSEFYRQNPSAAFQEKSPYVTILSRHPVDVVRMSDMNNIKSCHSRGNGYFQCAVAESRGHGPIAYLVPVEEFERYFNVDLDEVDPSEIDLDGYDEEVFADPDRGIRGMDPAGRVRLRKFVHDDDGRALAVPERRTYGAYKRPTPPNFLKGVTDWALENQKDVIGDVKKFVEEAGEDQWTRYGGSYEDNPDGEIMAAMLEPIANVEQTEELESLENFSTEPEDEDEIESELEGGSVEAQAEEVQDYADQNLEHFSVYHEIMEEENLVYFNANTGMDLDAEFNQPIEGDWDDHEEAVNEIIMDVLDDHYIYARDGDPEIYNDDWRINIPAGYDDQPNPEGFRSFVDELMEGDRKWDSIIEDAKEKLIEAKIIESELTQAVRHFKTYDNLLVNADPDAKRIVVNLRETVNLNPDYRLIKQFPVKVQDKIKEEFLYEFGKIVRDDILKPLAEKTDVPEGLINFYGHDQGYTVDLDGINLVFNLIFTYKHDTDIDAIKRMLNLLNVAQDGPVLHDIGYKAITIFDKIIQFVAGGDWRKPVDTAQPPPAQGPTKENLKKTKISDKMLFESWRRYLDK